MLDVLVKRLKQNAIDVEIDDAVVAYLAKKGFDPVYGARPLRRSIQSMIEDRLAEHMLESKIKTGDRVHVSLDGEQIQFKVNVKPLAQAKV